MLKFTLLIIVLILRAEFFFAQNDTLQELVSDMEPLPYVEKMPAFQGGPEAMYDFIYTHINYPVTARMQGISGMVIIEFVVDIDSVAKRLKIVRGIGAGCDEEVMRVMEVMNSEKKWIPGQQNGKPVPVSFVLPVTFRLEEPKNPRQKKE
jgi:protein TonB